MRLQVGNEFQQLKIKDLNDRYNVQMFLTAIKWSKSICDSTKSKRT